MIDENINDKPYKKGDKLILEIVVTDEEKSFDFLCKSIMNKIDTSHLGFNIEAVAFWKDRYINNIPEDLRKEIIETLQESVSKIENLIIKN